MLKKLRLVEISIFSVIALILVNTIYGLFSHSPKTIKEQRTLASQNSSQEKMQKFLTAEINCEQSNDRLNLSAAKIRIEGKICGRSEEEPVEIKISTNHPIEPITILTDLTANRFSSDFISLLDNQNEFKIEFIYKNKKSLIHELVVNKP